MEAVPITPTHPGEVTFKAPSKRETGVGFIRMDTMKSNASSAQGGSLISVTKESLKQKERELKERKEANEHKDSFITYVKKVLTTPLSKKEGTKLPLGLDKKRVGDDVEDPTVGDIANFIKDNAKPEDKKELGIINEEDEGHEHLLDNRLKDPLDMGDVALHTKYKTINDDKPE